MGDVVDLALDGAHALHDRGGITRSARFTMAGRCRITASAIDLVAASIPSSS